MSELELPRLMRIVHQMNLDHASRRHALRTNDCPPLFRFPEAARDGWTTEEQRHASDCPYCQKVIAMQWRIECPSLKTMVLHLSEMLPERWAMKVHLEVDHCPRCNKLASSPWLKSLAAMLREGRRSLASMGQALQSASCVLMPLPVATRSGQGEVKFPLEIALSHESLGLQTVLRRNAEDELEIVARSASTLFVGSHLHFELLAEGVSLGGSILLESEPAGGCGGKWILGRYSQIIPRLGKECVVLSVLVD